MRKKKTYKVICKYFPPSINRLNAIHWASRGREIKEIHEAMYYSCKQAKIPDDFVKVKLTYTVYKKNKSRYYRDCDNLPTKYFQDSFCKHFMVTDDDSAHLSFEIKPFVIDKNADEKIEIEIRRIDE